MRGLKESLTIHLTSCVSIALILLFSVPYSNAQQFPDEHIVTLDLVNVPVDSALLLLIKASGVNISYDPAILPQDRKVSLSANYLKLGLALDNVFVRTNLIYKIIGDQLVIVERYIPPPSELVTLSGRIMDAKTGELLVNASVVTDDYKYAELSNEYGYYSVSVPRNVTYHLSYSYLGYNKIEKSITPVDDVHLDIHLESNNLLNEIVIVSSTPKISKSSEQFDAIPLDLLSGLPGLAGETDVLRLAQMKAGVTSQADGFGGMMVRGGSVDQNLILFDGVPIYNTGHALGLFSIFNSSAIKSARLIKGGIPARFGGRLSSVFDVHTKEGNNQKMAGELSVSPLMAKAIIEGPFQKGKSSFFLTARRTIIDPWLKPLSKYQLERNNEKGSINLYFYDINVKVNFKLGNRDHLFLSAYMGKDVYENEVESRTELGLGRIREDFDLIDLNWGNQMATIRWTHEFGSKLFGFANLSLTNYRYESYDFDRTRINPEEADKSVSYSSRLYLSDISDRIGSYQLHWFQGKHYFLRLGASYTDHQLSPGLDISNNVERQLDENDFLSKQSILGNTQYRRFGGSEMRFFVENEIRIGRRLVVNIGAHLSFIEAQDTTFTSLQPRFSAKIGIAKGMTLKIGYTEMDQFFHLLSSGGLGLPNDVWLPSTKSLPPERSRQFSGSLEQRLGQNWILTLRGYKKYYDSVIGFVSGSPFDIREGVDWEGQIPIGTGSASGLEFELQRSGGPISGWLSYTYGNSNRTFKEINNGLPFRAGADRRHILNINLLSQLNKNMDFGLSWTYATPTPVTLPSSQRPVVIDDEIFFFPVYDEVHNGELPAYHKLDANINIYNTYDWGSQKLSFGVYNAYGRRNPYYIDLVREDVGLGLEQISLIPFLPYVSLAISF